MQREQQQQPHGAEEHDENAPPAFSQLPPQHPSSSGEMQKRSICYSDDDNDDYVSRSGRHSLLPPARNGATPMRSRRLTISGSASRKSRRKTLAAAKQKKGKSPAHYSDASGDESAVDKPLSQGSELSAASNEDLDMVEGAGIRSRIQEMQQRITQLEKEKMALSMSKAPLEARFRQKEDTWIKEQNRLLLEIESLKASSKESDDRYKKLEYQSSALEEECRSLRFAARKAASTINSGDSGSDTWSRQAQNDREVVELREKVRHAEEEIKSLRLEQVSIESELSGTKIEYDSLLRNFDELQAEYDDLEASKSQNSEAEIKLQVLTTEHIATSAQLNAVCADLAETKSNAQAAMDAKEEEWKKEVADLKFEISVLKARGASLDDEQDSVLAGGVEDEVFLRARVEERDARIKELEMEVLKGEQVRRRMHNRIQELRGNIRVFVRTRPFLPGDGKSDQSSIDVLPDGESLCIEDPKKRKPLDFKFDKVFAPSAGQNCVFEEVSEFVQSALDGYNVCLFSYGQTGSGKTHTMQGSGNGAMRGIIPRAVEQILTQAKAMQGQKWKFNMSASFLEIYNEDLKDLLVHIKKPVSSSGPTTRSKKTVKLSIKRNANKKSYVDGLTHMQIDAQDSDTGMEQLHVLMEAAARARSVATTKMNSQSSRSHSVFMLHLKGVNEDSGAVVQGSLNLCDLAGSERLDRSGAGSDAKRLKETQAINKSLSCLGDVFNALATGASHIPFRNSKLTYLLQDCLSGDGKALMFVNLSPTMASSSESVCSLRFAQRVNQVELGKAVKHIEYSRK